MANRYWTGAVNGGTGTWDATNTTNWSTTSGGVGGASVPTTNDVAFFDANSGSGVCTFGTDIAVGALSLSAYAGTLAFSTYKLQIFGSNTTVLDVGSTAVLSGLKRIELTYSGSTGTRTVTGTLASSAGGAESNAPDIYVLAGTDIVAGGISAQNYDFSGFSGSLSSAFQTIFGNLVLSSTMTTITGTSPIVFSSTNASPRTITTNGVVINFPLRFNGVGGTWNLSDNLTLASNKPLQLYNGTFNSNGKNVSVGGLFLSSGTKTLNLSSSVWTVTGDDSTLTTTWNTNTDVAGLTVVPGTATINMTSANTKTFAGGGKTWPTLNQGGAGRLIIQQANTFANITNTVQPATITFPASTTTTVSAFTVSGTSGNLITLNSSTSGTRATLSDASGVNSVAFCDIKDINATGGATWDSYAANGNIDSGNNLNWNFGGTPAVTTEVTYQLRSFTTPRRF